MQADSDVNPLSVLKEWLKNLFAAIVTVTDTVCVVGAV